MSVSTNRRYLFSLAVLPFLFAACSEHTPVYTVRTDVAADGTLIQTPRVTSVANLRRQAAGPGPRVQVEETTYDSAEWNLARRTDTRSRSATLVTRRWS